MIITRTVIAKFALTNETFEKMLEEAIGDDIKAKEEYRKNPTDFFQEYTLGDLKWDDNLAFIDQDITTTIE